MQGLRTRVDQAFGAESRVARRAGDLHHARLGDVARRPFSNPEPVERTDGRAGHDLQYVGVDHRRADVTVAEQLLYGADVGTGLQQMGRK